MDPVEHLKTVIDTVHVAARSLGLDPILAIDVAAFMYAAIVEHIEDDEAVLRLLVKGCASRRPEYCMLAAIVILSDAVVNGEADGYSFTMHV